MDIFGGVKREILHRQAEKHYSSKNYRAALKEYEKLLKTSKAENDELSVMFYEERLGDCYEKLEHRSHEERLKDHDKAGKYYIDAANKYRIKGDHEKAGEIYEKGAKAFEELDKFARAAEFYNKSGIMFSDVGDYFNASFAYHKAAEYYEKDDEKDNAASMYQQSAVCDLKVRDTASASANFKKAAKNFEHRGEWNKAIDAYAGSVEVDTVNRKYLDVADTYEKMANAYYELDDQKNAVYYHLKAADLRAVNNDKANAALSYREVGKVTENAGDLENALKYYLKSAETYYAIDNVGQAASSYVHAGKVCENLGNLAHAAKHYLDAGKARALEGNQPMALEAYNLAGQTYLSAVQNTADKKEGAKHAWEGAKAYHEIGNYVNAAKAYTVYANLMDAAGDAEQATRGFDEAAKAYAEGGMIWEAAESYVERRDYKNAAPLYESDAQRCEDEKDLYGAGVRYMEAGNCYRRLQNEANMKARLDRAISYFKKYADSLGQRLDKDTVLIAGDSHRKSAECRQWLGDLSSAKSEISRALKHYTNAGDKGRLDIANAYDAKLEGIRAVDRGDYETAEEDLKKAISMFDSIAATGNWKREYTRILLENKEECLDLIDKIKLKPEIELDIDRYNYTFTGIPVILNMDLKNSGSHTMKNISFLEHLPENVKLSKLPEPVPELPPGESHRSSLELTPAEKGEYRMKPIEVYYEDQKGHKYVKASNETGIEVVEKPPADFKNYAYAVEVYQKYARSQQENGNWFQAGDGYRQMAEVYGRFRTDNTLQKYYMMCVENYTRYVQENADQADNPTKVKRLADALWYAGTGQSSLEQHQSAEHSYTESAKYYEKMGLEDLANRSLAFSCKEAATRAAKSGDYEKARQKSDESLKYFSEVIKSGYLKGDELGQVKKGEDEVRVIVSSMQSKPQINVTVSAAEKTLPGEDVEFRADIENPLDETLVNVRPVIRTEDGWGITQTPKSIGTLQAGETAKTTFKLKAEKSGHYRFSPVDVTYEDTEGKSYMKGANEVEIEVEGKQDVKENVQADEVNAAEPEGQSPEVSLYFEEPLQCAVGEKTEVDAVLANTGSVDVTGIRAIGKGTDEVEIANVEVHVDSLKAGEKTEVRVSLQASASGEHILNPVELFYRDVKGKRYFKSSEELTVKCG